MIKNLRIEKLKKLKSVREAVDARIIKESTKF